MPTYDYICDHCKHQEEVTQKITAEPLQNCPACKNPTFRRGIGGGGALLRFKGNGFYITDYCQKPAGQETASNSTGCGCKGSHNCS